MPSSSAAQHRWIGWLSTNPEARKAAGMSKSKADEWLHADKGSPWKRASGGPLSAYGSSLSDIINNATGGAAFGPGSPPTAAQQAQTLPQVSWSPQSAAASSGGSGGPTAPQTPTYQAAPQQQFTSAGLIPGVGGSGGYQLDPNTGALTPQSLSNIQNLAQRGLPIIQPAPPGQAAAASSPTPGAVWNGDTAAQASVDPAIYEAPLDNGAGSGGGSWRGGRFADGGVPSQFRREMAPYDVRQNAPSLNHPTGLVASATPGRKDVVPLSVASGSYVVPADVVSGISEGNTLAGAGHLEVAMHSGPGGIPLSPMHARSTIPHPPSVAHLASGGMAGGKMPRMVHPHEWANRQVPDGIPVMVAGGEYILGPDDVKHIGDGDITRGHDKLDQFVLHARSKNLRATAKLPGPKGATER